MVDETSSAEGVETAVAQVGEALAPGEPLPRKVVDFDAGETFSGEYVPFTLPFKLGGVVYTGSNVRMPVGSDVDKYFGSKDVDNVGILTAFTGLPIEALTRMSAVDYRALDLCLGKLFRGSIAAAGTN